MSPAISKKTATKESDEIDFGRFIGELIDHRKLIIAVTSVFVLLAVIYALFTTPVYQANALIQVEQKQGNAILDSISQMLPDSQPQSAPEVALLQSRMVLGKTVDDLNLQISVTPKYFPLFGRGWARLTKQKPGKLVVSRLYLPGNEDGVSSPKVNLTVLDKDRYRIKGDDFEMDGRAGELLSDKGISIKVDSIDAQPGARFNVSYSARLKAINDLSDAFSAVDQGKDTGILNLNLSGNDPQLIATILDSISQNYVAQNIARQAAQDEKSLEFLKQQLPKVRADLDLAEDKLNQYRRQKDSVDLSLEAKSVLSQIVNADNNLNELTFREAEVSQLFTKDHPTYKALLEKRQTLLDEKAQLNQRITAMPAMQQEVLRLSRDVESGRAIYMMLLNRQQELNIAKSSAIGNVRLIDSAVTEPKPIKPKKILVVLGGLIMGGILSVGLILLRVFLRRGIETPEELEAAGISVYASIPISEWLSKNSRKKKRVTHYENKELCNYLAVENPADMAIEAMRSLRTSLHFAMLESRNNVLMISGAIPNVGKTFISTNLAAVIAQGGKKVLLIDADMRKGTIHKLFKETNENGLSDLLSGRTLINNAVKRVRQADFDFISRGHAPANPAELLMHPRLGELVSWASKNYDLVIIDTPPVLAVTDAAIIGQHAGTTLFVARFESNTVKEIEVSIKRLEQSGVRVKGCVLNFVVKKASSYYGYGYDYHGYSYGDDIKLQK